MRSAYSRQLSQALRPPGVSAVFDKGPQDIVHAGLPAPTGLLEPRQHIGIDADVDVDITSMP